MFETKRFDSENLPSKLEKEAIVNFLFDHLEEYGDSKVDILKAIEYSVKEKNSDGGFTLLQLDNGETVGVVVINKTGMTGYIPENILVYLATHKNRRGQGFGKMLMKKAIENTEGDIALHVEADNPAKYLYEKFGFTTPYMEMRLKK